MRDRSNEIKLGKVAGLSMSAVPSALVGFIVMWVLLSGAGMALLRLSPGEAIVGGLIATLLHWVSAVVHQLGHAWAARWTGHPMPGLRFWGVFSTSLYPADEPVLPGRVHIRRALGGPLASLVLMLVGGVAALVLRGVGGVVGWVAVFFVLENLLVFTLGALLPLGFTDGSTLLKWWGK